jgi:hypothetical protein
MHSTTRPVDRICMYLLFTQVYEEAPTSTHIGGQICSETSPGGESEPRKGIFYPSVFFTPGRKFPSGFFLPVRVFSTLGTKCPSGCFLHVRVFFNSREIISFRVENYVSNMYICRVLLLLRGGYFCGFVFRVYPVLLLFKQYPQN